MLRTLRDFAPGDRLTSGTYTVKKAEVIQFARRFDPQSAHLENNPRQQSLLGNLSASGWQTAAISMRLFVETMQVDGVMVGVAVDKLRWPRPVRPGDQLRVEIKILRTRRSRKRPQYGLLRYRCTTRNQENEVVQSYLATAILPATSSSGKRKPKPRSKSKKGGR